MGMTPFGVGQLSPGLQDLHSGVDGLCSFMKRKWFSTTVSGARSWRQPWLGRRSWKIWNKCSAFLPLPHSANGRAMASMVLYVLVPRITLSLIAILEDALMSQSVFVLYIKC